MQICVKSRYYRMAQFSLKLIQKLCTYFYLKMFFLIYIQCFGLNFSTLLRLDTKFNRIRKICTVNVKLIILYSCFLKTFENNFFSPIKILMTKSQISIEFLPKGSTFQFTMLISYYIHLSLSQYKTRGVYACFQLFMILTPHPPPPRSLPGNPSLPTVRLF